jgi:hypothetical protein
MIFFKKKRKKKIENHEELQYGEKIRAVKETSTTRVAWPKP